MVFHMKTFVKSTTLPEFAMLSIETDQRIAVIHREKASLGLVGLWLCSGIQKLATLNFLNIRTPKKFAVLTVKFDCGSTIE